jgi:hypothetical protein
MTSYAEQVKYNPALAAFVQAEIARAGVELAALKVEAEHAQAVIAQQAATIRQLEAALKDAQKGKGRR